MTIAIKIRHTGHSPAGWKRRTGRGSDANVVVKIPYRRVSRAGVVEKIIRLPVFVEVSCRNV